MIRGFSPVAILALLLLTLRLLPITEPIGERWESAIRYRLEITEACFKATEDRTERYLCTKIPRFESSYREDVGRCLVKGAVGELTAWQILPRGFVDRARLCRSLEEDALVAVERIRESRSACHRLPNAEQLSLYARGNCVSEEGRRLSRHRWPYKAETRSFDAALDATFDAVFDATLKNDGSDERETDKHERSRARAERQTRRRELEK
jgi:hypothetical protein